MQLDFLENAKDYFSQLTSSTIDFKFNPDLDEGYLFFQAQEDDLNKMGAQKIVAHGLTKGCVGDQFKNLINILVEGTSPDRNNGVLYTGPLVLPNEKIAFMGPAIGSSGGTSYNDGGFILLAKSGCNNISSKLDIAGFLINESIHDELPELTKKLQKTFPYLIIEPFSKSVNAVARIIDTENLVSNVISKKI